MLITLISLSLATLSFFLVYLIFNAVAAILPALVVLILCYFLLSRKLATSLEPAMKSVQEDLLKAHTDRAITKLKDISNRYGLWQFFLRSSIDGQIGSIYYMLGNYKEARPFLEKAFIRHWVAKAMLALIYYRERKMKKVDEVFSNTTRFVKKAGLLWSIWAYCLWRNGDKERAIATLAKGKSYMGESDPHLTQNLLLLQNNKPMKMKAYGEQWYQFQLELTPQAAQARQGRVRFQHR
jgi:tetratricopeptide (TPR) repeat protein